MCIWQECIMERSVHPTNTGVKQGCPLSLLLFNLVIDEIMREVSRSKCGLAKGFTRHHLNYADNIYLLFLSQKFVNIQAKALEPGQSSRTGPKPWDSKLTHAKRRQCGSTIPTKAASTSLVKNVWVFRQLYLPWHHYNIKWNGTRRREPTVQSKICIWKIIPHLEKPANILKIKAAYLQCVHTIVRIEDLRNIPRDEDDAKIIHQQVQGQLKTWLMLSWIVQLDTLSYVRLAAVWMSRGVRNENWGHAKDGLPLMW